MKRISIFVCFVLIIATIKIPLSIQADDVTNDDTSTINVSITPNAPFLMVGDSVQLTPSQTVYPIWYSDNSAVASVNSNGVVTAHAEGTTTVHLYYLTANNIVISGSCQINVVSPATIYGQEFFFRYSQGNSGKEFRLYPGYYFPSSFYSPDETYTPMLLCSSNINTLQINYNNCKWNLEELEDGTYVISHSTFSGYILSASSSNVLEDSSVILKPRPSSSELATDDRARWRIFYANGAFVIVPVCAENDGYALGASYKQNGTSVYLRPYDYNHSLSYWQLFRTTYYLDNYYDETLEGNDFKTYRTAIYKANSFVSYWYNLYFGIQIKRGNIFSANYSALECPAGNDTPCSTILCGTDCSQHHKNYKKLLFDISNIKRDNSHAVVKWMNRPWNSYCHSVYDSSSATYTHHSNQSDDSCIAAITNSEVYNENSEIIFYFTSESLERIPLHAFDSLLLMHEVSHLFGLPDVYDDITHENQTCYCVMKKYRADEAQAYYQLYSNDPDTCPEPYCDACFTKLSNTVYENLWNGN